MLGTGRGVSSSGSGPHAELRERRSLLLVAIWGGGLPSSRRRRRRLERGHVTVDIALESPLLRPAPLILSHRQSE